MRTGSNDDANVYVCSCCIYAQMRRKYDIYFTFASFMIPLQINNFDMHLLQMCPICKNTHLHSA